MRVTKLGGVKDVVSSTLAKIASGLQKLAKVDKVSDVRRDSAD